MPTKREYLVSKGLAQPGRGRFNKAALAELERARTGGTKFSDEKDAGSADADPAPSSPDDNRIIGPCVVRNLPKLRDITEVSGYTPEGYLVKSAICFKCSQHVAYCPCKAGIKNSPIVTRWSKTSRKYGVDLTSVVG